MMPLPFPGPVIAATLIGLGAGFAGGYAIKGRLADAAIARAQAAVAACQRDAEAERRAAAEESARRLAAAQAAESAAVTALHATRARLDAANRRIKESLYALPTAGHCGLSGAARGLLNARIRAADDLPESAALSDRAPAEPAADSGQPVHEADLGGWIADAISRYDDCRARIDAIRRWDEMTHMGASDGR